MKLYRKLMSQEDKCYYFFNPNHTHFISINKIVNGNHYNTPIKTIIPSELKNALVELEKKLNELIEYNEKTTNTTTSN